MGGMHGSIIRLEMGKDSLTTDRPTTEEQKTLHKKSKDGYAPEKKN
jgi:hypothetical protein